MCAGTRTSVVPAVAGGQDLDASAAQAGKRAAGQAALQPGVHDWLAPMQLKVVHTGVPGIHERCQRHCANFMSDAVVHICTNGLRVTQD